MAKFRTNAELFITTRTSRCGNLYRIFIPCFAKKQLGTFEVKGPGWILFLDDYIWHGLFATNAQLLMTTRTPISEINFAHSTPQPAKILVWKRAKMFDSQEGRFSSVAVFVRQGFRVAVFHYRCFCAWRFLSVTVVCLSQIGLLVFVRRCYCLSLFLEVALIAFHGYGLSRYLCVAVTVCRCFGRNASCSCNYCALRLLPTLSLPLLTYIAAEICRGVGVYLEFYEPRYKCRFCASLISIRCF